MDCYSAESEFIESLDFLSPPVKRLNSSRQGFSSAYNTDANDVHLLSDFRKKLVGLAPGLTLNTKPAKNSESSTSLILKKTSEGQILGQQYSVLSFPSLYQPTKKNSSILKPEKKSNPSEKPLIKVTVIPKTDSIQAAKLLRRRRQRPTKVQSTSSNHENSIQTKNVFLIVAGRRKEKIYEIKTTGSAKLSSDHDTYSKHEDIPIAELSNFKHLFQSLDMDKKKKKKEKKVAVDTSDAQQTKEWKRFSECNNCVCVREPQESPKRSRVRIFGQFGISEDDKYVLRYGATVNDKEVMSDVAQLTRDFSPIIAETSYGTIEEPSVQQQDSCLQADYNYELDMEKPPVTETVSRETHGTQVNFNVQVATQARCATFSDKKTQCTCCGYRSDNNTLKDCQSPMVIISVYPKSSPEDLMKSVVCPTVNTRNASPAVTTTYSSNQVLKTEKVPNKSDTRRNYKSPLRSRSPSPVKKVSRSKVPDDSNKGQVSEKRSPDRQKALRAIKDKIREKDQLKQESPRKFPLKSNNATQASKNLQNVTVSNATQMSKSNQRHTTSQATQVTDKNYQPANTANRTQASTKRIKNYTTCNGTQFSNESNSTQCGDSFGSLQTIARVKHSLDEAMAPKKYPLHKSPPIKPLKTQVSNATQVPKILYSTHATQVSRSDPLMNACATQVSKPRPNAITPRMGTNQEKFIPEPLLSFKSEQTSRPKTKAESGTNTEQARAKKALVETYTKKLAEQMYQHDYIPARFDNSKVTINIDGDREHYNVLFNQDNLSTGLTIRKTIKDMGALKCINESSLGSLLCLSDCVERGGFKSGNNSPTRCPSIALCNDYSEDELPLLKHDGSRLTIHDIRDSLEICHRREDKSISNNLKNTQTDFTAQLADNVPEESELSAPMKHFPGDDCSISDPIARDKQIRELLGVDNVKANYSKASQSRCCDNNVGIPYHCIYRQRCKESQVTEINYGLHKLCPCFDPNRPKEKTSVSVQCRKKHCKARLQKQNSAGEDGQSAIYQQLILNRNIQVFLQVEQFSKQKPIILSRKQYDKVKKTIQKTISMKKSNHVKRNNLLTMIDSSEISIGEVRVKKVKSPESLLERFKIPKKILDLPCLQHQKKAKDQTPEVNHECRCEQTDSISSCCKPDCQSFDKTGGKSRRRKSRADIDMKGDYFPDESSDRDETKLKKDKRKEELEPPETVEERDYRGVRKENVDCEEQLIAKRDMHKRRPELNDERDVEVKYRAVRKENVDREEQLIAKKDMHKRRPELNEERDVEVNYQGVRKENVDREEQLIAKKDMHKRCLELNEERDVGVNVAYRTERPAVKDVSVSCECDNIEVNHSEVETFVLFNAENNRDEFEDAKETEDVAHTRKTMSSVQIRYASVAYMKQLAYSSTDVGAISDSSLGHLNSFQTLFTGRRKSATPNLGTSAYSLYSEDGKNSDNKCAKMEPQDSKPKKPFLRRLMSCLVMRSTGDSELKLPVGLPPPNLPSVNSSIDSYHISTSLAAVEVSSSIYDTSASFYSNHSIHPINSKIKRGFFSSVRGFLTNRKS